MVFVGFWWRLSLHHDNRFSAWPCMCRAHTDMFYYSQAFRPLAYHSPKQIQGMVIWAQTKGWKLNHKVLNQFQRHLQVCMLWPLAPKGSWDLVGGHYWCVKFKNSSKLKKKVNGNCRNLKKTHKKVYPLASGGFNLFWTALTCKQTTNSVTDRRLPRKEMISQIFPEMKVIPEEELSPSSCCGCPPQLLFVLLLVVSC